MEPTRGWLDYFFSLPKSKPFVRIDDTFLMDPKQYMAFAENVEGFDIALSLLQGKPMETTEEDVLASAELLYGLLHAKYLLTDAGLERMREKFLSNDLPTCPRILCHQQPCLPLGLYDGVGQDSIKLYCPKCNDIYRPIKPTYSDVDGAYFGDLWYTHFIDKYPDIIPENKDTYVPRIFGFRIHSKDNPNI